MTQEGWKVAWAIYCEWFRLNGRERKSLLQRQDLPENVGAVLSEILNGSELDDDADTSIPDAPHNNPK